ncbi:hypothetical protein MMC30_001348 [Trapelia coarctata]|nr:hypothetical protein [Trapelia coarctata]
MAASDNTVVGDSQESSMQCPVPTASDPIERASSGLAILNTILLGDDYKQQESTPLPTYTSTVQGVTVVNTVIGSFGLQVWDPSEPVLCSVAGTPAENTFYTLARGKFRKGGGNHVTILRADKQALQMFELKIDGIRFALQYYQARNPGILSLPENASTSAMTAMMRKYCEDAVIMRHDMPELSVFQASYRWIKNWALRKGVYSSRFSYLSEPLLLLMVSEAYHTTPATTWQALCSTFFRLYSTIDIERAFAGAASHSVYSQGGPVTQVPQDSSRIRFSEFTTRYTLITIEDQIKATHMALGDGSIFLEDGLFKELDFSLEGHDMYWHFVKIDLSYWGPSQNRCGRFIDLVESEIANIVTRLGRTFPRQVASQVWPRRMKEKNASADSYEVSYFIAVGHQKSMVRPLINLYITSKYLEPLESNVHASPKFDEKTMFIMVQSVEDLRTENLIPDDKDWSLIPEETNPDDSDDEADEPSDSDTLQQHQPGKKKKPSSKHPIPAPDAGTPSQPLRPALDILNRIRHDPNLDEDDYVIGYLDRHAGIMRMSVSLWTGGDSTAEEFIPQSRIKYFERLSDGVRIWDRETRLDRMFGSGQPVAEGQ